MKNHEEKLLREFVKAIIVEDDTGGHGYYPSGAMNGMGGGSNYGDSLKKVFVDPFIDAGKVIKASSSKLLLRMKTLAKIAIETILTTMIPFLQSNYEMIFKNEREELQKIHEKYKKNFEGVDRAFTGDAAFLAFMISPEAYITTKFIANSPQMALSVLETLAVGNEGLTKYFEDLKKRLQMIEKELKDDVSNYKISGNTFVKKGARGPYMTTKKKDLLRKAGIGQPGGAAIRAENFEKKIDPRVELVMSALKNPNVMRQLSQSPLAKSMKADAFQVVDRIDKKLFNEARNVLSAQTLQDLEKMMGRSVNVPGLEELEGQDRVNLEDGVLKQVKASMKEFYVQSIKKEIASLENSGVDSANLYIKALHDTVSKLAAL